MRGVQALALGAWAGLAYVVVELDPERVGSRVAFFTAFGLALFATFGLAAYGLSYSLFSNERYRGNLGRSLQHGAVAAGVCLAAVLLQAGRSFTPLAAAALFALFLIGQTATLLRK